jgi:3',5'-cyclic AMP phosphodiesterase CpdA
MRMRKSLLFSVLTIALCLVSISAYATPGDRPAEQGFSIAVLADPRGQGDTWKNALLEIRNRNAEMKLPHISTELIIVAGDMDPLESRYQDYRNVFTNAGTRPILLPVIGNHEFENGGVHFRYARDILIPSIDGAVRRHPASCDYYFDYRNVRIIAVDGYTDLGEGGVINEKGRQWVEQVIRESPSSVDHIFITFHEPAFPRFRHIGDSFDKDPELRNAFWQMLLGHREKVRAVLVGHTHRYYRMRVHDPGGKRANDPETFPDEDGGIFQIDAGSVGNGLTSTITQIQIERRNVSFRVLQAKNGVHQPFFEVDRWSIAQTP